MGAAGMSILQARGAQPPTPSRYKAVWTDRFFQGYFTNRNLFRSPLSVFYAEGWGLGKTDALCDPSQNVELTVRLTLARRPGFSPLGTLPYNVLGFYAFRQIKNTANATDLIVDTTNVCYKFLPSPSVAIFTKSAGAGITRCLGIGNTLYMSDGPDLLAWQDGNVTPNPRNWGISIGPFSGISGPNNPGAGADVAVSGGAAWTNPGNLALSGTVNTSGTAVSWVSGPKFVTGGAWSGAPIVINGVVYTISSVSTNIALTLNGSGAGVQNGVAFQAVAVVSVGNGGVGNTGAVTPGTISGWGSGLPVGVAVGPGGSSIPLLAQNLGFSVPLAATITGVRVAMTRTQASGTSALYSGDIILTGVACTAKADAYGASDWAQNGSPTYGAASDLWGATLTPAIVNATSFGVSLVAVATGGPGTGAAGEITAFTVTVYYSTGPATVSDYLEASTYGFNISTSTATVVQGVIVTIAGFQGAANPGSLSVQLLSGGVPVGTPKTGIQLGTALGTITLGSISDLWGTSNVINPAAISATGFGVAIQALNPGGTVTGTWNISEVEISLYAVGGPPVTVETGGTLSCSSGYQYVAAYGNSNSGHISTCTPPSISTGPYTGASGVQVGLTASTDPQVDKIWLFRTADGGSLFYATSASPYQNTTANVLDATAGSAYDPTLNILLPAPIDHANDPPQAGWTVPVFHMGRVWMANGNTLQCSGGPDTITGNGSEAFPPDNFFTCPSNITRMVPTASGLVLFLVDQVMLLSGGPAVTQFYLQPLVDGIGLLAYDALDTYGSTAYLYTADRQFLSFDMSSGLNELGFPVENKLASWSPTVVSVAYHTTGLDRGVFVCDGTSTWLRCTPQQPPDFTYTGPVWSPPGVMASGGVSLMKSIETSAGNRQLLCASEVNVGYRDSQFNVFSDFGTAYSAYFTIGSIILANPGQLAELGFLTADFARVGTSPGVAVLMDEVAGVFSPLPNAISDPPRLYGLFGAPVSLYSNRYNFKQSPPGGGTPPPVWCRHLQIQVSFGADTVQNEIFTNTVWGTILEEGAA